MTDVESEFIAAYIDMACWRRSNSTVSIWDISLRDLNDPVRRQYEPIRNRLHLAESALMLKHDMARKQLY